MRKNFGRHFFIHPVRNKNGISHARVVVICLLSLLMVENCKGHDFFKKNVDRQCKSMTANDYCSPTTNFLEADDQHCHRLDGFLDKATVAKVVKSYPYYGKDKDCPELEFPYSVTTKDEMDKLVEEKLEDTGYMDAFDLRDIYPQCPSIAEVTDQGLCDSCWAIASTDVMTDRLCIRSNGTIRTRYSAADLLSCCRECRFLGRSASSSSCERGGIHRKAWSYWKKTGLVTGHYDYKGDIGCKNYQIQPCTQGNDAMEMEAEPEYDDDDEPEPICYVKSRKCPEITNPPKCDVSACDDRYLNRSYDEDIKKGENCYHFTRQFDEKETAIKLEILMHGPVHGFMSVYESFYTGYSKHKDVNEVDPYLGPQPGENGKKDGQCNGHSIRIIGWGKKGDKNYWIVANSWGNNWGNNGFFHLDFNHDKTDLNHKAVGKEVVYAGIPKLM